MNKVYLLSLFLLSYSVADEPLLQEHAPHQIISAEEAKELNIISEISVEEALDLAEGKTQHFVQEATSPREQPLIAQEFIHVTPGQQEVVKQEIHIEEPANTTAQPRERIRVEIVIDFEQNQRVEKNQAPVAVQQPAVQAPIAVQPPAIQAPIAVQPPAIQEQVAIQEPLVKKQVKAQPRQQVAKKRAPVHTPVAKKNPAKKRASSKAALSEQLAPSYDRHLEPSPRGLQKKDSSMAIAKKNMKKRQSNVARKPQESQLRKSQGSSLRKSPARKAAQHQTAKKRRVS